MSKNPYGNRSRRGRGWMLIVTVVILLIAAGAWIFSYTYSTRPTLPSGVSWTVPSEASGDFL